MRKKAVKKILAGVTMLALVAALSACGSSGNGNGSGTKNSSNNNSENPTSTPSANVKQEVSIIKMIGHTTWFVQGMEAIIPVAKENGFELEIEKVPDGDDGANLMKTRFATNDKPDILFYQSGITTNSNFGNPADVFVAQDDQPWMTNFDKTAWKNLMDTIEDGHWYGAPYGGADMGVVLYNKKLFEQLNLQIPTNMDEFWAVAEAIKAAGKTPVYFSGQDAWTLQLPVLISSASQQGATLIPQFNVNKAKITDWTDRKAGMTFMQEVVAKGYVNKDILSSTYDNAQKELSNGDTGMYFMATWVMNEIVSKYPDGVKDIGAFVMPYKGNEEDLAAIWAPKSMYVVKGKNQENAQKFVNWFEQPEIQDMFFAVQGGIPTIKGVTKTSLTPAELDAKKYLDEGKAIGNTPYPFLYGFGSLPTYLQELLVKNGKTPDQVLEAMQKEMEINAKAKDDPNFK
jgi:raffinose/stachyose/melibiose transport system substrate-binding protein